MSYFAIIPGIYRPYQCKGNMNEKYLSFLMKYDSRSYTMLYTQHQSSHK